MNPLDNMVDDAIEDAGPDGVLPLDTAFTLAGAGYDLSAFDREHERAWSRR